jgi:hypothetical protein
VELLWVNVFAGTMAATVYIISATKAAAQARWVLCATHSFAAVVFLLFAGGYMHIIYDPEAIVYITHRFRVLVPFVLLAPAVARFLELRREEREEALAISFTREMEK